MAQPLGNVTLGRIVSMTIREPSGKRRTLQFLDPTQGKSVFSRPGIFDHLPIDKQPVLAHDQPGKILILNQSAYANVPAPVRTSTLKGKISDKLIDQYTALHEGAPPNEFFLESAIGTLGKHARFGSIEAIEYWKRTPERTEHVYRHPFELPDSDQPVLVLSTRDEFRIINQDHVIVTERGIEDQMALRSSYRHRRNPFTVQKVKRATMSAGSAGIVAVGTILGMQWLFAKLATKVPTTNPAAKLLTGYPRAVLEGVVGILGSVVLDSMLPEMYAPIAAGFGVGGIASGGLDAVNTYRAAPPAGSLFAYSANPSVYGLPYAQPSFAPQAQAQYAYGATR